MDLIVTKPKGIYFELEFGFYDHKRCLFEGSPNELQNFISKLKFLDTTYVKDDKGDYINDVYLLQEPSKVTVHLLKEVFVVDRKHLEDYDKWWMEVVKPQLEEEAKTKEEED